MIMYVCMYVCAFNPQECTGVTSKNADRTDDYLGRKRVRMYLLKSDHFTRQLHGTTRISKAFQISRRIIQPGPVL